ncbi:unnamed protein product [Dovyalis caffra]|uniref:Uncharacterized protein n=1 Tax=Dovyalis caffra TaxID=77055 RepID=A0AAV1QRX5_9ROSI|nr:unnamed protein product [Dovyalis caffra]
MRLLHALFAFLSLEKNSSSKHIWPAVEAKKTLRAAIGLVNEELPDDDDASEIFSIERDFVCVRNFLYEIMEEMRT